tara:strand:+ start:6342 stop:7301 length:960 start_codon:yes stop_codon:yes gene_type:complete
LKLRLFQLLLLTFIVIFGVIGPYNSFLNIQLNPASQIINIEKGSSNLQILKQVKSNLNSLELLYIKLFLFLNDGAYQSGEYQVQDKSIINAHNQLLVGDTITHELLIIPGMNKFDITKIINESYLINDCMNLTCTNNLYGFNEGMVLPDTYFYKKDMKASTLLKLSSDNLIKFVESVWLKKSNTNPVSSIKDSLILASIIEKEAGNDSEKKQIASVFLKRLEVGMKLQADPTIIYGLMPNFNGDITRSNLKDKNNLYNTYTIKSLPPSPISVSSKTSIEAAILSEPGDYLYFVANKKGSHYFSKTYKEHLEAVKLYQLK